MTQPTPICAFDVSPGGVAQGQVSLDVPDGVSYRWLHFDINDPHFQPWAQNHLEPLVADALLAAATRPRCATLADAVLLNLRGVNLNPGAATDDMVSVRLWVTERLIVSARIRKIFAIDDIRSAMDTDPPADVAALLTRLTQRLTDRIEDASIALDERTDELDEAVETGAVHPQNLLALMQPIHRLRRYVRPQKDAIGQLSRAPLPWLQSAHPAFVETANRTIRISEELESAHERLRSLRDHLGAVQNAKMGRNSYVLSIVAAIFLPLGFLTGLFGVNVAGMPGMTWPWAFAALSLATLILGLGVAAIMRWARWV